MLLAQIEAFVEVARTRTVSRAADALFITQPALTARIQRLEADLDTKLFVRTPRGMKLTEAGEAFLPYAVSALDTPHRRADAGERVRARRRRPARRSARRPRLDLRPPAHPQALLVSHPRVGVSVRTGHSEEVLDLVLREQVDLGLVRELRHPDIVSTPLYEDRVILVVEPGHRFAARGPDPPRRDGGRAARPLRPHLELHGADERRLPRRRRAAGGRDGARQHRRRQEDGAGGLRRRPPPADAPSRTSSRPACSAGSRSRTRSRCGARSSRSPARPERRRGRRGVVPRHASRRCAGAQLAVARSRRSPRAAARPAPPRAPGRARRR